MYIFSIIVDKIDHNKDGLITQEELKDWIKYTQRRYIIDDVDRQWKQHNPDNKDTIQWEDYKKLVYGFMEEMEPGDDDHDEEGFSYKSMLRRDRRRWSVSTYQL